MSCVQRMTLPEIENQVCDIAAEQLGFPRRDVSPASRLIQDLNCDSLELVVLLLELEDRFDVSIRDDRPSPICKAIFTRGESRLSDIAEVVYLQQGTGKLERRAGWQKRSTPQPQIDFPFCQLGGRWSDDRALPLFERLDHCGHFPQYRRRSDGMRCVLLPGAEVEIGTDDSSHDPDAGPRHMVQLDPFMIDSETVSTTAYCRFLNTIGRVEKDCLLDWFLLADSDDRAQHVLIEWTNAGWNPVRGCEAWPMILVSWHGANAYSLWANGKDWHGYRSAGSREEVSFLPSEAQWEYAARGPVFKTYPWGDDAPSIERMRFGQHAADENYTVTALPMGAVHERAGMSPFGLHHMSGNVWQWCRDWYDERFYSSPEAGQRNALNRKATGVRSERGGSWVGPAELCRSSYRRGRPPFARGRCLGFRCVSEAGSAN